VAAGPRELEPREDEQHAEHGVREDLQQLEQRCADDDGEQHLARAEEEHRRAAPRAEVVLRGREAGASLHV
jgi:hypothetical protein